MIFSEGRTVTEIKPTEANEPMPEITPPRPSSDAVRARIETLGRIRQALLDIDEAIEAGRTVAAHDLLRPVAAALEPPTEERSPPLPVRAVLAKGLHFVRMPSGQLRVRGPAT